MVSMKIAIALSIFACGIGAGWLVRNKTVPDLRVEYAQCTMQADSLAAVNPDYRGCTSWGAPVTTFRMMGGRAIPFTHTPCLAHFVRSPESTKVPQFPEADVRSPAFAAPSVRHR